MRAFIPLALLACLYSLSCHESLPPRSDPGNVFTGGIEPYYVLDSGGQNAIWLCMKITNIYEETFQESLRLQGTITIVPAADTTFQRTLVFSDTGVFRGKYDRYSKILTIDPDSSFWFHISWDFSDDRGRDARSAFDFTIDRDCTSRMISTQSFLIRGHVKVMDHTHDVILPSMVFTATVANIFVRSGLCRPVSFDRPCY